jgi:hypothetical protein
MVYLRAESVFIHEHYFVSESFAAAREAFSTPVMAEEYLKDRQYTDW